MNNLAIKNRVEPQLVQPVQTASEKSLDQNQDSIQQQWNHKKGIPALSTPEAKSFATAIEEKANLATEKALGVEKGLGAQINTPNFRKAFESLLKREGIESNKAQQERMVNELAKQMELDGSPAPSPHAITELQRGAKELQGASDLLAASQVSRPNHAGQGQLRDALESGDGHQAMIQAAIHGAKVAEEQVRIQAQRIEEKLAFINKATKLERLLTQYKHLDTLDLKNPLEGQEKNAGDFATIDALRGELQAHGLEWQEGKWTSKGDLESIIQGVRYVIQGLTSQNSTMQIELQGKHAAATQYLLIASTMMRTMADLQKEIARNIRG